MISLIPQAYADTTLDPIKCYGAFCDVGSSEAAALTIEEIITLIVGFLTIVAGLAFLIYFMVGGLSWLTAGGDKGKVESAKQQMTNGAIGMIIVVAAYGIVWIVGELLGIDILNPAALLQSLTGSGPGSTNPNNPPAFSPRIPI